MQLDVSAWYVRWFFWSQKALTHFSGAPLKGENKIYEIRARGTNICEFFRVLTLGTLVGLASLALFCYIFFSIFILPFLLFPAKSVGAAILLIWIGMVAVV